MKARSGVVRVCTESVVELFTIEYPRSSRGLVTFFVIRIYSEYGEIKVKHRLMGLWPHRDESQTTSPQGRYVAQRCTARLCELLLHHSASPKRL
jgi:hypothetical protein